MCVLARVSLHVCFRNVSVGVSQRNLQRVKFQIKTPQSRFGPSLYMCREEIKIQQKMMKI